MIGGTAKPEAFSGVATKSMGRWHPHEFVLRNQATGASCAHTRISPANMQWARAGLAELVVYTLWAGGRYWINFFAPRAGAAMKLDEFRPRLLFALHRNFC